MLTLRLFFVAVFLNALCWVIFIPIWQYPDEQAHFAQVQDFAEINHVPTDKPSSSYEIILSEKYLQTERDEKGDNPFVYHPEKKLNVSENFYGPGEKIINDLNRATRKIMVKSESTNNPPLYYFLSAVVYKIFNEGNLITRVLSIRFFSLLLFMTTIFLTWKIATRIFKNKKIVQITYTTLIAFSPMYVFSSTGVLVDPLTNLLFTAVIFLCINILINGFSKSTFTLLAMTIILGTFTRQHFIISFQIVIVTVLLKTIKNPEYIKRVSVILFLALAFLFLSNFATSIPVISNFRIPEGIFNVNLLFSINFLQYSYWTFRHTFYEILPWFWGVYKWLSLTLPHQTYQVINRVILFAVLGFAISIIKTVRSKKKETKHYITFFMVLIILLYYSSFLIWDYFFHLSHNFSFGIQGRYFFPLIIPIFYILTNGILEIVSLVSQKSTKFILFLLSLLMIAYNNFSLYFVVSSYYNYNNLHSAINVLSQYKPDLLKGNILIIIPFLAILFEGLFIFSYLRYILNTNESN